MPKILNLRQNQNKEVKTKASPPKPVKKAPSFIIKKPAVQPAPLSREKTPQINWDAPSFYFNPQKKYLSLLILALAVGGAGMLFFSKDMLTSIFMLLASFVLVLYSTKRPEISKIIIDHKGVAIGSMMYYYKDLRSFWIHYDPGSIKELSLEVNKWYMPYVNVSIENKNPLVIRSLLINFLPEKEHEHSLVDIIARKIGL